MANPRDYSEIDEFLGKPGKRTDVIEENLGILTSQDFENLNSALMHIGPQDPIGDWKNEMYKDNVNGATAEIVLCWRFRDVLGNNAVTLNAEYTESGKDFDLLVEWNDREYWIDVRVPEGALAEIRAKDGGWISGEATGSSIDNKLEKQFKQARELLPDDAIHVLAVHLNATLLDQLLIDRHYHDIDPSAHPGQYCDAFLEYYHRNGRTVIDVRELTDQGELVSKLHNKILEN